jgi:hypothetical protein
METPVHGSHARSIGLATVLLASGLGACATTQQSASIQRVDHLVSRVEAVHLEAELAKSSVYDAMVTLRPVMVPTEGDPAALFQGFMGALANAEERAAKLRGVITPMEYSARDVFSRWERDLRDFANDEMRERSRDRMLATRMHYDAVARSARRASASFDELNGALRDVGLFLGHDFNPTAIALVQEDALAIRDRAQVLGAELDKCMAAAAQYVKSAAPLGVAIKPVAPSPTATSGTGPTAPAGTGPTAPLGTGPTATRGTGPTATTGTGGTTP